MHRNITIVLTLIIGLRFAVSVSARTAYDPGAVFAMTNTAGGNEIIVYSRAADGTLTFQNAFATDGLGQTTEPDDALGSQNPLILSPDRRWLLAVNAGSDTISVFRSCTTASNW